MADLMSISADFREKPHRFVVQLNQNLFCLLISFTLPFFLVGKVYIKKNIKVPFHLSVIIGLEVFPI